jgi:hypothetical protein
MALEFSAAPTDVGATNFAVVTDPSAPQSLAPIAFYPDGSSDSVEVVLSSMDDEDLRQSVVKLSGITGALRHRMIMPVTDGSPNQDSSASPKPVAATSAAP